MPQTQQTRLVAPLAFSLFTLFASLFVAGYAHSTTAVGQKAPDFTLTDTAGKAVRLSDYKGKHVVLEWNNPGCPFVRKHYDSANMHSQLQIEKQTGSRARRQVGQQGGSAGFEAWHFSFGLG